MARHLAGTEVLLPDGAPLTVEAFQSLGGMLGQSTGSDELHYLLEDAFDGDRLSDAFLHDVHGRLSFATAPLYAALHEPCYAQGTATRWSAQRIRAEFAGFDPGRGPGRRPAAAVHRRDDLPLDVRARPGAAPASQQAAEAAGGEAGLAPALRPGAAWPPTRSRSRRRSTSTTCTYPASCRCRPAEAIGGLRAWVTSEYEHDGLRVSDGAVLRRLIDLAHGLA